ncbi:hypothetical protein EPH95_02680 [Salicibibacter halophilus]|uniref:Phage protein n=1 Tax=Salicibibacter halophilus TaxID=2502791 RepID=A0A514LEE1_9BACI|nr:tail assembly chaperone [Salicibibacter halophilus]QDI90210.1 hypothetical protein EPH95_02680 [Salicibibacter halophilus]
MNIEINGKGYELNFGMKFIKEMDKRHFIENNGVRFGNGINMLVVKLDQQDPLIIQDIVEAGLHQVKKDKPSTDDIEQAIEDMAEEKGLNEMTNDFLNELKKKRLLADKIKNTEENIEKEKKKRNQSA